MFTPEILSSKPSGCDYATPAYDWETQSSGISCMAGYTTSGTIQTFGSDGKPKDSQDDKND